MIPPIEDVLITYPNGAQAFVVEGELVWIKYNSGDQIWFKSTPGQNEYFHPAVREYKPVKVKTYDGIFWEDGMRTIITRRRFWKSLIPLGVLILMIVYVVVKNYWF